MADNVDDDFWGWLAENEPKFQKDEEPEQKKYKSAKADAKTTKQIWPIVKAIASGDPVKMVDALLGIQSDNPPPKRTGMYGKRKYSKRSYAKSSYRGRKRAAYRKKPVYKKRKYSNGASTRALILKAIRGSM